MMTGKSEVKTNPSNGSTIYRCVTYNILSKPLARTEQFVTKTRDELDWKCRFPKIKTKLTAEIEKKSIICLQEIPRAADFYSFFVDNNYTFVQSQYGTAFNNYMGVGIAYPNESFKLEESCIKRVTDDLHWSYKPKLTISSAYPAVFKVMRELYALYKLVTFIGSCLIRNLAGKLQRTMQSHDFFKPPYNGPLRPTRPTVQIPGIVINTSQFMKEMAHSVVRNVCSWVNMFGVGFATKCAPYLNYVVSDRIIRTTSNFYDQVKRRYNTTVMLRLKDKTSERTFVIATYHMPCVFYAPNQMLVHTNLLSRMVYDFAAKTDSQYIVAGDFNFLPDSPCYKLMTTGKINYANLVDDIDEDADYDTVRKICRQLKECESDNGITQYDLSNTWYKRELVPHTSAYYAINSKEPDYTNCAITKNQKSGIPFCETLDYIFGSKGIVFHSVDELKDHKDHKDHEPLPTKEEPSDHLMIGADFWI